MPLQHFSKRKASYVPTYNTGRVQIFFSNLQMESIQVKFIFGRKGILS